MPTSQRQRSQVDWIGNGADHPLILSSSLSSWSAVITEFGKSSYHHLHSHIALWGFSISLMFTVIQGHFFKLGAPENVPKLKRTERPSRELSSTWRREPGLAFETLVAPLKAGGGGNKARQFLVICELGADYWSFTCQNCSLWDWRGMSPRTFEGGQSERLNFFDQGGGVILGL